MIVVDSSVWIDQLTARRTSKTALLIALLGNLPLGLADLSLTEILQGIRSDADFRRVERVLDAMEVIPTTGVSIAVEAAQNYCRLRALGITVRSTINTLIATRCIVDDHQLLHSDRDFDGFERHLGLRVLNGFGD